jgi:hypothetical protein
MNGQGLEPRILLEDASSSYHATTQCASDNDIFDNQLIFGNNLLGLKALEQGLSGMVKCIVIDPPYNTGSAFEQTMTDWNIQLGCHLSAIDWKSSTAFFVMMNRC